MRTVTKEILSFSTDFVLPPGYNTRPKHKAGGGARTRRSKEVRLVTSGLTSPTPAPPREDDGESDAQSHTGLTASRANNNHRHVG